MKKRTKKTKMKNVRIPAAKSKQVPTSNTLKEIRIRHRELIDTITSSGTGFQTQSKEINPGVSFPWAKIIAEGFESYQFHALKFVYVPMVGTSTDGVVGLHPDYDPADDNTSLTSIQLSAFQDSMKGPVWSTIQMNCSKKNLHKMKQFYIRYTSLEPNLDIKTYDPLSLTISIDGSVAKTLGELYVEYDITFYTPQLQDEIPNQGEVTGDAAPYNAPFSNATTVGDVVEVISNTAVKVLNPGEYNLDWMLRSATSAMTGNPSMISSIKGPLIFDSIVDGGHAYNANQGTFNRTIDLEKNETLTLSGLTAGNDVENKLRFLRVTNII